MADFLGVGPSTLAPLAPLAQITTNAVERAPIADDEATYPVLVMLVGIKGSYRQIQTFQAEALVSNGHVVAAIDQPYSVALVEFPDGRRVAYDDRWAPSHSAFERVSLHDDLQIGRSDARPALLQGLVHVHE